MANKESAFTISYDQYGDFVSVRIGSGAPIYQPTGNIMKDPPAGRLVARKPLGELLLIDLGDGRFKMCRHIYSCDCVDWIRKDVGEKEPGFSVSFDQYGDFVSMQIGGGEPIYQPTHNLMKDPPAGSLVTTKPLGELVRVDLGGGRHTMYFQLPNCDVIELQQH